MVTPLGPVSIPVTLNTAKALQELDALEKRVKEIGSAMAAQGDFQARATTRLEDNTEKARSESEQLGRQARAGRFGGGIKQAASAIQGYARVAGVVALGASVVGAIATKGAADIREATQGGNLLEKGAGELQATIMGAFGGVLKGLSDKVTALTATVEAFFPSLKQTKDLAFSIAVSRGDPTKALGQFETFFDVQTMLQQGKRQKAKIAAESVGTELQEKTKELIAKFLSGGVHR